MTVLMDCLECTNKAEVWPEETEPLCEWCSHSKYCDNLPRTIRFFSAWLTGESRARCTECNFVSALWECGCDLWHDCEVNQ